MWDHPRSRGVYRPRVSGDAGRWGSSPLARGLPTGAAALRTRSRIIPARAGFTARCSARFRSTRDHPRSRGVYPTETRVITTAPGSSPLARGLRHQGVRRLRVAGIIPARAGFTPGRRWSASSRRDHPRSRGVYEGPWTAPVDVGDHPRSRGVYEGPWTAPVDVGDHPRSRGVYTRMSRATAWTMGSSPLARGLRPRRALPQQPGGIIPARAGFTLLVPIVCAAG